MSAKRKFLFLYLNTGGGHRSAANVIKNIFQEKYPNVETVSENGFAENDFMSKLAFEKLYHFSMNYVPGIYSLIYRMGGRFFQTITNNCLNFSASNHIANLIKKHNPTDIVCFHFGLGPAVTTAIKKTKKSINYSMVVTDPFTAHSSWFYDKKTKYYVFSDEVRNFAIEKCKIPPEMIEICPFLINQKFRQIATKEDIKSLRVKHNLPLDKKIVLLTGGGEGLPNMIAIVKEFILRKVDFTVVVVCGRDARTKSVLDILAKTQKDVDVRVYGFINFMDEIVKTCDCAVIKAGPASLMEVLVSKKAVIMNHFIYGQELGNVEFALKNKVGLFIRDPKKITKAVDIMLHDEKYLEETYARLENLPISFESEKLVDSLMAI